MKVCVILVFLFGVIFNVFCQKTQATIVDLETNENIPYAFVKVGDSVGLYADSDGFFEIEVPKSIFESGILHISSIGYKDKKIRINAIQNSKIFLQRDVFLMNEVVISDKKYTLSEIINKVKKRIDSNYNDLPVKRKLFFKEKDKNRIKKLIINFKKSTIPEINQGFVNNELREIPKQSSFFTEVLANWYDYEENYKLDISKAAKFYDTFQNDYLEVFNTKLSEILNRNFKKDSYFKIKSGIFSLKTEINDFFDQDGALLDMRNEMSKKEEVNVNFFFNNTKKLITSVLSKNCLIEDTSLNVISKSDRYNFELKGTETYKEDLVYRIEFFPKRGEDYKGIIFVNTLDFAIMRIDYQNVAELRSFKLLGLSFKQQGFKGSMIYEKNTNNKYELKYIEQTQEDAYGINRPLKIIEKNNNLRGRKKQNEIAANIDFASTVSRRFQVYIYATSTLDKSSFQQQVEGKNHQPKNWIKYDSSFWKDTVEGVSFDEEVARIRSY